MCFDMKNGKKTYFNGKIPVNDCRNVWRGLKSIRLTKKKFLRISKVSYWKASKRDPLNRIFFGKNGLRGNCTPNQTWARFVRFLKVINIFWKFLVNILKQIVRGTKNGITILIGQSVLGLLSKTIFCMFQKLINIQEPPAGPTIVLKLE